MYMYEQRERKHTRHDKQLVSQLKNTMEHRNPRIAILNYNKEDVLNRTESQQEIGKYPERRMTSFSDDWYTHSFFPSPSLTIHVHKCISIWHLVKSFTFTKVILVQSRERD